MAEAVAELILELEQSQKRQGAPACTLSKHLAAVDVMLDTKPMPAPGTLQRLVSVLGSWLQAYTARLDTVFIRMILKLLAKLLPANMDNCILHEAAVGIVRGLSRHAQYREDIVSLGFVDTTITAMRTFSDSAVLLKEACGVFGNLASAQDLRVRLGDSRVIQEVLAILSRCRSHEDRKVAKLALGALSNLAACEKNREIFSTTEAVPVLLGAAQLFMDNENILEYAIGAISHIAVHHVCNQQLVKAGAVEAMLVFISEHTDDLQVITKALVALRRILKQSGGGRAAVLRQISRAGLAEGARGVSLLVEVMREHIYDDTVVREASLLLTSLSAIPANVPLLMAVAVQPCMKALELHPHEVAVGDALAELLARLPIEEDESWASSMRASLFGGGPVGELQPC